MATIDRFIVVSHGPRGLTGTPNEQWFYTLPKAKDEVRRRLQVRRFDQRARRTTRQEPSGKVWQRDGLVFHCIGALEYRDVPNSNPDFESSGGCILYQVRATTEDRPIDFAALFPPKRDV